MILYINNQNLLFTKEYIDRYVWLMIMFNFNLEAYIFEHFARNCVKKYLKNKYISQYIYIVLIIHCAIY